jgi:DNA repair exonuclease SbcCD ATPase subunit
VYRLRTSNEQVRSLNEARSNDFNVLKQEAQKLKLEFEQRNKDNEKRVRMLNDRIGEERARFNKEKERYENAINDREERISQLLRKSKEDASRIEDLEYRLRNEVALVSPSLSNNGFANRVSAQQYRKTKSYNERRDAAVVGGLPLSYRPRSLTQQNRVTRGEGGTEPSRRGVSPMLNNGAMVNSWDRLFTAQDLEQEHSDYDTTMINGSGELWQN